MTPEEKIAELSTHIKKELPKGCANIECTPDCPLFNTYNGTVEYAMCKMLDNIRRC